MVDLDYFDRRLRRANELAQAARDPAIARIHLEFARQYEAKIEALRRSSKRGLKFDA